MKIYLNIIFFLFCFVLLKAQNSQESIKGFALNYYPVNIPNGSPSELPQVNSDIKNDIENLIITNKKECEQYLTLILLKLYAAHLECCHQSYDLREKALKIDTLSNPILYYFVEVTKFSVSKEFVSSSIGYDWVAINPSLLKYKPIKKECKRIEKISEDIHRGKFW